MPHLIYPKDCIRELLISEIEEILPKHPYLSFSLICLGIEFLGKCLDSKSNWNGTGKSEAQFYTAITSLFPPQYEPIRVRLYKELRCGMLHSLLTGSFKLTEVKNAPNGELKYEEHIIKDQSILVADYFYFDFVQACIKVMSMTFPKDDKMNKPLMFVGPLNQDH